MSDSEYESENEYESESEYESSSDDETENFYYELKKSNYFKTVLHVDKLGTDNKSY